MIPKTDTILFMMGLLSCFMGLVCLSRKSAVSRTGFEWMWCGFFFLLGGFCDFAAIIALALPATPFLEEMRAALLAASFLTLFEFSRSRLRFVKQSTPPAFIGFALLILGLLLYVKHRGDALIICSYVLGLPASVFCAWVLRKASAANPSSKDSGLTLASVGMTGYAVALIVLAIRSHFSDSTETILGLVTTPIPLLQTICMAICFGGFCLHWQSRRNPGSPLPGNFIVILMVEFAVIAALAIAAAQWRERVADSEERYSIVRDAEKIGRVLDPEQIKSLSFTEEDAGKPLFERVRQQMITYARTERLDILYSVALREGSLHFGPESIPQDNPMASKPGAVYNKPPDGLLDIFHARRPFATGPYEDEYGTFISGYAPVMDPRTGKVLMVVGVDTPCELWQHRIAFGRMISLILALFPGSVLFFGQYLLYQRHRDPSLRSRWYYRRAEILFSVLFGGALTVLAALAAQDTQQRENRIDFLRLADAKARIIESTYNTFVQELSTLGRFVATTPDLDLTRFASFTQTMSLVAGTQAWEWVPCVPAAKKDSFEARMRDEGMSTFYIHEKGPDGKKKPVAERNEYYPVTYVMPYDSNKAAIGFDLGSEFVRRAAIDEAVRTGLPTASAPIRLVQETERQRGALLFHPIYNRTGDEILGLATGIIRIQSALGRTLVSGREAGTDLSVDLVDKTVRGHSQILASYPMHNDDTGIPAGYSKTPHEYHSTYPIFLMGRSWMIDVFPEFSLSWNHPNRMGIMVGIMGLALTLIIASLVALVVRHQSRLETVVEIRTRELRESERRFAQVAVQSGELIWETDIQGSYTYVNQVVFSLLGYEIEQVCSQQTLFDLRPLNVRKALRKQLTRILEERGEVAEFNNQMVAKDGRVLDVVSNVAPILDDHGSIAGFRGSDRDITETLAASNMLRVNEERLDLVIKGASIGLWDWNVETGAMVCNERWAEIEGRSLKDLEPVQIDNIFAAAYPDDSGRIRMEVENHLQGSTPILDCEYRTRHANGHWVWIQVRGKVAERDASGRPLRMTGTRTDITQRKDNERQMAETASRILKQNNILAHLPSAECVEAGDVAATARALTEMVTQGFGIGRVSVWEFCGTGPQLLCLDAFDTRSQDHSCGMILHDGRFAIEPAAFKTTHYLDANDPLTDPRTAALVETYLKPMSITSVLDALIRTGEQTWGVLCFEHVATPHQWTADEIAFACQLADQMGMTLLNRERRKVQEALHAKTDELDRFFTVNLDLLCIADMKGRFYKLNPEWESCLGYAIEELIGQTIMDFVHPDDAEATSEILAHLAAQEPVTDFTNRYRHKDGSYRWLEWRSFPVGDLVYAAARDITERKEAQETALRKSEDRFRTLLSLSNDAIFVLNDEALCLDVNDRACKLVGYAYEKLIQFRLPDLYSRWRLWDGLNAFNVLLDRGEVHFETELVHSDGSTIPVEVSASRMLHDTGLYQAVARDISERKKLHQHFLASIEAERRTLGQELHDGLCQELKSLEMTAALLEETLIHDDHPASATMETMGKDINRMVVSAYGLAAGMLPASLDTRYFGDALRKLAKNLQRSTGVNVEIRVPADIRLKSDMAANHLYRIVQEAAGNATRHGGATTLVFECGRSETEFLTRIIDDGHGFEIKEKTVGGLGISVMRSRAEALGGSLRIEQRPSGGVEVICACPPDILQGEHHA